MFQRSANLIIVSSVMGALAIFAVALRFFARTTWKTRVCAEDYLIVIGLLLALGICACNIIGAAVYRFGNHEIFIQSGELEGWPEADLLLGYGKLLHCTAMPVIKCSLLLFLNRLFGHHKGFRIMSWIVGVYVFLWWFTTFWMTIFQCWPISSNWGTTPEEMGDCIPNYMLWYAWTALLNAASDVVISAMPIPVVLRLQMSMRKKIAVLSLLSTAVMVIVAGIGRTVGYFTYNHDTLDFSYVFYDFLIWTSIEPCLGVVGVCTVAMGRLADFEHRKIYQSIKDKLSLSSLRNRTTASSTGSQETHVDQINMNAMEMGSKSFIDTPKQSIHHE